MNIDLTGINVPDQPVVRKKKKREPRERVGLWGKAVKVAGAVVKTPIRLIGSAAQFAGHLSVGDVESAMDVPGIIETGLKAYRDTAPSLKVEALKGLETASQAAASAYHLFGHTIPSVLGAASAKLGKQPVKTEAVVSTAKEALMELDRPFRKKEGVYKYVSEELSKHYPETLGPGVSYIVYQEGNRTLSAKVNNKELPSATESLKRRGAKIVDVQTVTPNDVQVGPWQVSPADAIAFASELADPLMAIGFGKATVGLVKALRASREAIKHAPTVDRALAKINEYATKITAPGTVASKILDELENSPVLGLTLRKTTKALRSQLYPKILRARALDAQLLQQKNIVTRLLRGGDKTVAEQARQYLAAIAAGDKAKADTAAMFLVNHGLIDDTGDIKSSAESILRIHDTLKRYTPEQRMALERLAYDYATGDTIQQNVLARIEKNLQDNIPLDPLDPELQRAYRVLRNVNARATKLGVNPQDLKVVANAISNIRGGLGIHSEELYKVVDDFGKILDGKVPKSYLPTPEEATEILKHAGVEYEMLDDKLKLQLAAGVKAINSMDALGASSVYIERSKTALKTAMKIRSIATTKVDNLVRQLADAETVVRKRMAPSPLAPAATQTWVRRVRQAVKQEAEANGLDFDVIERMSKMARDLDESWGRMQVDLGIITPEQFEQMRGIHIRRMLDFEHIEQRLEAIRAVDPVRAARIERNYQDYLATLEALENSGLKVGAIGTSIAKRRQQLTPEFRELMGEINVLSDAILISGEKAAHDISNAQLYRAVANSHLASDWYQAGWRKVPDHPTWGELRGKWVPPAIWSQLEYFVTKQKARHSMLADFWAEHVIGAFKRISVPYNPWARAHNTLSNLQAIQYATGITALDEGAKYGVAAMYSMLARDRYFQRFARYSPSVREATVMLHEHFADLQRLSTTMVPEKSILTRIAETVGRSMAWEEAASKMAIFHAAIHKLGMDDMNAVLLAEQWLIDYGHVPPIVDILRRRFGIMPFLTYSYKMIGNLGKVVVQRPEVIAKQWRAYDAFANLADPGKRHQNVEKFALPEWLEDNILIRLPGKEARYINLDPYIPWTALDVEKRENVPYVIRAAISQLGQPFKAFIDLAYNRNAHTGAEIVPEGTNPETAAKMRWEYLATQLGLANRLIKLWKAMGGHALSPRGKPQKVTDVLLDIRNYEVNREAEFKYRRKQLEIVKALEYARKILRDRSIDEETRRKRFEQQMQHIDRLHQEKAEIGKNILRLRGLRELLLESGIDARYVEDVVRWFEDQPLPPSTLKKYVRQLGAQSNAEDLMLLEAPPDLSNIQVTKQVVSPGSTRLRASRARQEAASNEIRRRETPYPSTDTLPSREILPGLPPPK